jgi:hypothetical protein
VIEFLRKKGAREEEAANNFVTRRDPSYLGVVRGACDSLTVAVKSDAASGRSG